MARLPIPGGDSGTWGDVLNDYLSQTLKSDGTIKDNAVTANTIAPNSITNSAIASDAVNATSIANGSITEALLDSGVTNKLNQAMPTWNTIGGKPAMIAAGADQAAARTAIAAQSQIVHNVKDYGAKGDGSTDDTTAIQTAITAVGALHGTLFFPEGTYVISAALDLGWNQCQGLKLQGAGAGGYRSGTVGSIIKQTSTTAHGIVCHDTVGFSMSDMVLRGPGSGSGDGIHFTWAANTNIVNIRLDNVIVGYFGGHGISTQTMITSSLRNVTSHDNGGDGFHLYGGGTSTSFDGCHAFSNAGYGWYIDNIGYCSWNACAADANSTGWYFTGGAAGCTLNGCGTEENTADGLVINGVYNMTVNGFSVYGNHHYGVWVQNNSYRVILNNIWETSGSGAVNSIVVGWGPIITLNGYATQAPLSLVNSSSITILQDGAMTVKSLTAAQKMVGGYVTLADAATITLDASLGNTFYLPLVGDRTLANPINPTNGQRITLIVRQGNGGGHALTFQWQYWFTTQNPMPTMSTNLNTADYFDFVYDPWGRWVFMGATIGVT